MKGERFSPGTRRGAVAVTPRAARAAITLEDELEGALTDAVAGDPPGPSLAKRLERVAREILLRRGFPQARVIVVSDAVETTVQVLLPPDPARVGAIVIRVESGA